MLEQYFKKLTTTKEYKPTKLGNKIQKFRDEFPSLENQDIALLSIGLPQIEGNIDPIRMALYELSIPDENINIVDLGYIPVGKTENDTYEVLKYVNQEILNAGVIPICIGTEIDQSEALYASFQSSSLPIEAALISHEIPILDNELLHRICTSEPNCLLNLNVLAFQTQYIPKSGLDTIEKLNFGHLRLGALKQNIELSEVYLRNADLSIIDLNAIQHADAPGKQIPQPSGLTSEEICQMAKYLGISDRSKAVFLSGYEPHYDSSNITAALCSHIIWFYIEGFGNRKNDFPDKHTEFVKYRCDFSQDDAPILFLKSKKTQRWWMKIENPANPQNEETSLVFPCSYQDYQQAANGVTPQRYLDALRKL